MQLGNYSLAADIGSIRYQQHSDLPVGVDFSYYNEQLVARAISANRPAESYRKTRLLGELENESKLIVEEAVADMPDFETRFADDSFSANLESVARIIAARNELGSHRQIFFVHFDGWDHHHKLLESQAMLLPILSRGLAAFRDALNEANAYDNVTTFTTSEFGRSLENSGGGSDHGWGGHHFIMGGAIRGGRVFGQYPNIAHGSALDVGGGSFLPTTSMEEYIAEMVLWLGVSVADLAYVLPDISKFWCPGSRKAPLGLLA